MVTQEQYEAAKAIVEEYEEAERLKMYELNRKYLRVYTAPERNLAVRFDCTGVPG